MDNSSRLILVEDDESLGYVLSEYLKLKSFEVVWVQNSNEFFQIDEIGSFDLVILDIMIPGVDGFKLALSIQSEWPNLPFLFLTSRAIKVDVLKGLMLGAEDYIIKPVDEEELVLRIQNILKRTNSIPKSTHHFSIGNYIYNYKNQTLRLSGKEIMLTKRENELLYYLFTRMGSLCLRKDILKKLWGKSDYFNRKSMDVFISRLRKYLSGDPSISIENVHGEGFILKQRSKQL